MRGVLILVMIAVASCWQRDIPIERANAANPEEVFYGPTLVEWAPAGTEVADEVTLYFAKYYLFAAEGSWSAYAPGQLTREKEHELMAHVIALLERGPDALPFLYDAMQDQRQFPEEWVFGLTPVEDLRVCDKAASIFTAIVGEEIAFARAYLRDAVVRLEWFTQEEHDETLMRAKMLMEERRNSL